MTGYSVSADGERITYDTDGEGPPLVLVHGWSCDRSYWRRQMVLADRFQVVAIDLGGHGESSGERAEWTMESYGEDVVAVIDDLGLDEVVLVGHSMGGNAALEAARRISSRIRGVIWVDTYGRLEVPPNTPSVDDFVAPFRDDFVGTTRSFVGRMFLPHEDPAIAEWVIDDMSSAPEDVALASIHSSLSYGRSTRTLLAEFEPPIVAINSEYLGADLASLEAYGIEVIVVPNTGHMLMMTDVERFNTLLAETVARWTV